MSSGDAGVYGMAARTLARAAALPEAERPAVEVVPGVTAALAAGALLGAPLADDWASLSLSDLQVPWATVERRLAAVAAAGLALALYNPRSATRTWQLDRVLDGARRAPRARTTPVGLVTDAGAARDSASRGRRSAGARPRRRDDAHGRCSSRARAAAVGGAVAGAPSAAGAPVEEARR